MGNLTFDQVPNAVSLILEKLEKMEKEMATLKERYENAPSPTSEDAKDLMSYAETADFLGVKRNAVQKWKRDSLIPFRKIGSRVYFSKKELLNHNRTEIKKPRGLR